MKWADPKDPIHVGYYLVAFFDLLGQERQLGGIGTLPDLKNKQEIGHWFRMYFAPIIHFRQVFFNFLKEFNGKTTQYPVPSELKQIWEKMRNKKIGVQPFTDSFVLHVSLKDDPEIPVPSVGVFAVLACGGSSIPTMLAAEHAPRAGIEVGIAAELYENEVYGPALMQAYRLESKVARFPRVVIGKNLIEYLQNIMRTEGSDIFLQLSKKMASICLSMFSKDDDGQIILDYLGKGFRDFIAHGPARKEWAEVVLPMAYKFIQQQVEKWEKDGNEELIQKYKLLKNYFVSRLELWELKP